MGETTLLLLHYLFAGAAVTVVPLVAGALWALIRDRESELDRREHELACALAEQELYGGERCVGCSERVEPEWLSCPWCTEPLKTRCTCGALLKLHWSACPWCARSGIQRLPEPEHVPVEVADANLPHPPRPILRRVEHVGAAVA